MKKNRRVLWEPDKEIIENSNIKKFIEYVNRRENLNFKDYFSLYDFSVQNIEKFWELLWDYVSIIYSQKFSYIVDDLKNFPGAKWFLGAKFNYAENLLRLKDEKICFVEIREDGERREISYKKLYELTSLLNSALKKIGLREGDRVAAYMPNIYETPLFLLASSSLGAVWSSCGTEVGIKGVIDRFSQIEPKILFTVDSYIYKGKKYDNLERIKEILNYLPSVEKVIVVNYTNEKKDISFIKNAIYFHDFIKDEKFKDIEFIQVSYEHPLFIMFSSGTTGKPKCIVQSGMGVLINHLKELILHTDLKRSDVITYITSPSWMMWNWLMSSLFVGSKIVLYDGNPLYPDEGRMFELIEEERITIFGLSASYINHLKNNNFRAKGKYNLKTLREISQTGSPLSEEGFIFVYENIKDDLWLNSISGGTDINGCFAAGSPTLKVHAGELQGRALGMKVSVYDEKGEPIYDKVGELVCEAPSPSMPLYFWGDKDFKKYRETYFEFFKNKNVWRHGDYVILHSETQGLTFLGRSDSTLKIQGVRIGTSEIYNVVEEIKEIEDSLAVSKKYGDEERLILFVKLKKGYSLNQELIERIKRELKEKASPRHVPFKIIEAPDIPYTFNMKKVEIAVKNILNGIKITNKNSIINPSSLKFFEKTSKEI
ncbi:MAG: acetoacetate--CoA ligase [candidate division WOR-3 bacterium]